MFLLATWVLVRIGCSQVLSNSLDPGEVTKEEVHYLKDTQGTTQGKGHRSRFHQPTQATPLV